MVSDLPLTGIAEKLFLIQDQSCTVFDMNFVPSSS